MEKCTAAEQACIKKALNFAVNVLTKNNKCFQKLLQISGKGCTSPALTACILSALKQTKYTCADPGTGQCHQRDHNSAHTDTPCGILKSKATLGGVVTACGVATRYGKCQHPIAEANNCDICKAKNLGDLKTWLCRVDRGVGRITGYCETMRGLKELAAILVHEASHTCVGGHDTTSQNKFRQGHFDTCRRPDSYDIQKSFESC
jgi:hypothetical protein